MVHSGKEFQAVLTMFRLALVHHNGDGVPKLCFIEDEATNDRADDGHVRTAWHANGGIVIPYRLDDRGAQSTIAELGRVEPHNLLTECGTKM